WSSSERKEGRGHDAAVGLPAEGRGEGLRGPSGRPGGQPGGYAGRSPRPGRADRGGQKYAVAPAGGGGAALRRCPPLRGASPGRARPPSGRAAANHAGFSATAAPKGDRTGQRGVRAAPAGRRATIGQSAGCSGASGFVGPRPAELPHLVRRANATGGV